MVFLCFHLNTSGSLTQYVIVYIFRRKGAKARKGRRPGKRREKAGGKPELHKKFCITILKCKIRLCYTEGRIHQEAFGNGGRSAGPGGTGREGYGMTQKNPEREEFRLGKVLREYRKKAALSQQDLAERLSVTRNTVVNWENDRSRPDYTTIPALCALLGVPVQELFRGAGEPADPLEGRVMRHFRLLSPGGRRVVDQMISALLREEESRQSAALRENFLLVPVRPGTVAAGLGDEVPAEGPGYAFLRRNSLSERADGVVRVRGESMEPVYHDQEYVYFRNAADARPGEDVIVDTDGGAVIKRVSPEHTLFSVNPALPYPEPAEDAYLVIRGVVLGAVPASDRAAAKDAALLEELFADEIRALTGA